MRQYAFYSPEYNWIILQSIMDDCYIAFEWDHVDVVEAVRIFGDSEDPIYKTTWIPLGEL